MAAAASAGPSYRIQTRNIDGTMSTRSLDKVIDADQEELNQKMAALWEKAEEVVGGLGDVQAVNLTHLVVSYTDGRGVTHYVDLKGKEIPEVADLRSLVTKVWNDKFCIEDKEGFDFQGLGRGYLSEVLGGGSVDFGAFVASGQLHALMASLGEDQRKQALERIAHADKIVRELQTEVDRAILDAAEQVNGFDQLVRNKVSALEADLYRLDATDVPSAQRLRKAIQDASSMRLREREKWVKELVRLKAVKESFGKIDRDACYWAAGMGGAIIGDAQEDLEEARKTSEALGSCLAITRPEISKEQREQYAGHVGDLLLGSRALYLERVLEGKPPRTFKLNSLELFVVQKVLRSTTTRPERYMEKETFGILKAFLAKRGALSKWKIPAADSWEDNLVAWQECNRLDRDGRMYRAGRAVSRFFGRDRAAAAVEPRGLGRRMYEAMPKSLFGKQLRVSTADEVASTYFTPEELRAAFRGPQSTPPGRSAGATAAAAS